MYKVIYTKARGKEVESIDAMSMTFEKREDAILAFKNVLTRLYDEILSNALYHANIDVHGYKAVVKIEGTIYCIDLQGN